MLSQKRERSGLPETRMIQIKLLAGSGTGISGRSANNSSYEMNLRMVSLHVQPFSLLPAFCNSTATAESIKLGERVLCFGEREGGTSGACQAKTSSPISYSSGSWAHFSDSPGFFTLVMLLLMRPTCFLSLVCFNSITAVF